MKIKTLLLVTTCIFLTNAQSITFDVDNLLAGPADCNWMFQTNDATPFVAGASNNYAYRQFSWSNSIPSTSSCTAENLTVLDGTAGVRIELNSFVLKSFKHINTVNPNNAWNIRGEAGDERIYAGGVGEIYVNDVLKLRAYNCRLSVITPYPTKEQMNAVIGWNYFTQNIGTGEPVTGSGWGVIDKDLTHPDWVAAFDPHNTGQLEFDLSTISAVIQSNYGHFNFDIVIRPAAVIQNMNFADDVGNLIESDVNVNLVSSDVSFAFSSLTEDNGTLRSVFANQILSNPGGTPPSGIENISPQMYWNLGTTFKEFTGSVTFDISGITGVSNPNNLRILKRNNSSAAWQVLEGFTLVNSTTIRANNLTSFSEFAIGSTGDNPLPVELAAFTAASASSATGNTIVALNWQTATEVNNYGFEIERTPPQGGWETVGFVAGHGNSNSVKNYSFVDESVPGGKYSYRLKQIDTDGGFTYSEIVEVEITNIPTEYLLFQNYPNPFNPSTTIKFGLPKDSHVTLEVFNIIGERVTTLVNKSMTAGYHEVEFIGTALPSGIYIYKLTTDDFASTKKFVLMK